MTYVPPLNLLDAAREARQFVPPGSVLERLNAAIEAADPHCYGCGRFMHDHDIWNRCPTDPKWNLSTWTGKPFTDAPRPA